MSVLATHHAAATTPRRTGGRRIWACGAVAGVVSSLVVIALVALAEGAGVPMEIAQNSTKQPEHIPLLGFPATTTATTATKVVLEITHVVTAALIISAIAAHLPPRRG